MLMATDGRVVMWFGAVGSTTPTDSFGAGTPPPSTPPPPRVPPPQGGNRHRLVPKKIATVSYCAGLHNYESSLSELMHTSFVLN